jgi:transcriptional regulator with XRE-family HTH domain
MNIADNIKKFREEKGLLQKQVASEIGLKPAHYNKIEKAIVEPSIDIIDKLAKLFGVTIDQIVHMKDDVLKEVTIEDKSTIEQMRLVQELDEKDKNVIFSMIETMLTKKKFKDFFQKNIATL